MDGKTVTICGKRWTWKWFAFGRGGNDGECDPPTKTAKQIRVRNSLARPERQRRLMEVAIHEALHAADFSKDESWVEDVGESIAHLLWNLGYRRV